MWTYKGIDVFPADRNSSGILRADTKEGMRQLIRESQRIK
jgi:hypothetical protein